MNNNNDVMTAKATLARIKTSPQKLNIVASMIRGLDVAVAERVLELSRKRVAADVLKTLSSAIANAENNHDMVADVLYVKEAYVGKSMSLRRFHPRGRGRGSRIEKHFSNLSVVVAEREDL
ncbi:MAG: 50S ribosomal protein L22 [Holosporales bacterium]|nr:50S ribosomal protein L22 [Holosporales bacterium]